MVVKHTLFEFKTLLTKRFEDTCISHKSNYADIHARRRFQHAFAYAGYLDRFMFYDSERTSQLTAANNCVINEHKVWLNERMNI